MEFPLNNLEFSKLIKNNGIIRYKQPREWIKDNWKLKKNFRFHKEYAW